MLALVSGKFSVQAVASLLYPPYHMPGQRGARRKEDVMDFPGERLSTDDGIVYVPVPRAHLGRVYSTLAAATALVASTPVGDTSEVRHPWEVLEKPEGEAVLVEDEGWWTPEMIRKLHERLTHPGVRATITMMAQRAPKDLTLVEVEESTGISVVQLRAQLGALTKLVKKIFGEKKRPFSNQWGPGGVANYFMDRQVAGWWLDLTGEDPPAAA